MATLTTDKTLYAPNDTVTATITRAPKVVNLAGTAGSDVLSAVINIKQPTTLTDDAGHTWVQASDDGTTAVYTTKA